MLKYTAYTLTTIATLVHAVNLFTFFYPDNTTKVSYIIQEQMVTKVTFLIPDIVVNASSIFQEIWKKLSKPFNITYDQTMDAQDSIYLQAGDFFMLMTSISDLQDKHDKLIKTLSTLPKNSEHEKEIKVELDKPVIKQKVRNIQVSGAQLEILMNKTETIKALKADVEKFSKFLSIYEDLNSDTEQVFETLNDYYTSIQLTYHKVKTNYIQQYLLPEEQNDTVDLDFDILGTYIDNNQNVVSIIKQNKLQNPIRYVNFFSIPYRNMSLEHNYILNLDTQKVQQLFTPQQLKSGDFDPNNKCLSELNRDFPKFEKITNIINSCQFIRNHNEFLKTHNGLFLFTASQSILDKINKQFKNDTNTTLTKDNLPVLMTYNGSVSLKSPIYAKLTFNDTRKLNLTFSNLTLDEQKSISIRKRHITQYDFSNIDQLFVDNYPLFIMTTSFTFLLFVMIVSVSQLTRKCKKEKYKALDKFVNHRANKNRSKDKKIYKLSHF